MSETKNMQQHIFPFASELDELQNITHQPTSSPCSSVDERLVNCGSEALEMVEHGLLLDPERCQRRDLYSQSCNGTESWW
jgi:hypothetical protein